jgi:hypothetical protein
MGHPKRRKDFMPVLRQRLQASLARRYAARRQKQLLELYDAGGDIDAMPVHKFVDMLVP